MNRKFELETFRKAFDDVVQFQETALADGGKKFAGKSAVILVELEEDKDAHLQRAMMMFPFFVKDVESNRKITAYVFRFLDVCLPLAVPPAEWMQAATKKLRNTDEKVYYTNHDGIEVSMLQMKPELRFIVTAERTIPWTEQDAHT